jgi:hypothetical protein
MPRQALNTHSQGFGREHAPFLSELSKIKKIEKQTLAILRLSITSVD